MTKKSLIIYYLVLFVLLVFTWANMTTLPIIIRLAYLSLLFIPCFKHSYLLAPTLILFLTTALLSFGYTFLPTEVYYYIAIAAVIAIVSVTVHKKFIPTSYGVLFVLLLLITIVNAVTGTSVEKVTFSLLLFLLLFLSVQPKDIRNVLELVPLCFIIYTLTCSILILAHQKELVMSYAGDLERVLSGSINYTCTTIGIGSVVGLIGSFDSANKGIKRIISIATVVLSIIVLLLEASRGAILAVAAADVIVILSQKVKTRYKVFGIILLAGLVYVLYQQDYFDLLIYRIQADDGTGANRTDIWESKLRYFWDLQNPFSILFGIGFNRTWNLGGGSFDYIGCHNDFIAFLVEYGIVGIGFFFYLLLYPFIKSSRSIRRSILPYIVFIVVDCLTLEPISMGYLPIYFLLFYVYLMKSKDVMDLTSSRYQQ